MTRWEDQVCLWNTKIYCHSTGVCLPTVRYSGPIQHYIMLIRNDKNEVLYKLIIKVTVAYVPDSKKDGFCSRHHNADTTEMYKNQIYKIVLYEFLVLLGVTGKSHYLFANVQWLLSESSPSKFSIKNLLFLSEELPKSMPPRPSLTVAAGAVVVPRVKPKAFCPSPADNPATVVRFLHVFRYQL